ncbi:MAG: helix-turn-helix transcriptional regulator [Nitrospiraceae bacterium]|nr:helix-turn-helix transcriptional regulator [Nitrospiraceae bacterium]
MTRPQYGFLTAFIPARVPHRTRVLGELVEYQSLYFSASLSGLFPKQIVIFRMSELGRSLLHQLNSGEPLRNLNRGMERDCLNLFIKVLEHDLRGASALLELRTPADETNRKLCAYIEQQYHRKITAADCAAIALLSFRQLSRRFRDEMDVTVFAYLRMFRMLKASILLNTADAKMLDVAYQCGYTSVSSFFTDFKRTFSCSPVQFRRLQTMA